VPTERVAAQNPLFDSPAPAANKVAAALAHHSADSTARPAPDEDTRTRVARTGTDDSRRPGRAPMPSWEDVLLGTRSPGR
jgi:hypothetical protein